MCFYKGKKNYEKNYNMYENFKKTWYQNILKKLTKFLILLKPNFLIHTTVLSIIKF